jgi:hypothetical protein
MTDQPAEYVMVPRYPSFSMLMAGNRLAHAKRPEDRTAGLIYAAMLAAAPPAPAVPLDREKVARALAKAKEKDKPGQSEYEGADAVLALTGDGWNYNMDEAPRDGRTILIYYGELGIWAVFWDSVYERVVTPENGSWCVHDNKHGPYALRGYQNEGPRSPTAWRHLPLPPRGK